MIRSIVSIALIALVLFLFSRSFKAKEIINIPNSTPTTYQFPYKNPIIPKNKSYRTVLIGDSIVASLGPNANNLRLDLIKHYPGNEFVNYNYGYPSTNILSLYDRLQNTILKQGFDLIIIESFGNNPLSEYPLSEGLQKQNDELKKSVDLILKTNPNAALAFMTPIALDPLTYAKSTRNLSQIVRKQWVDERVAYIDNHRRFAENLGIPVIDVYKVSLKKDGTVDRSYISDDYIHPSAKGIELISSTIADYIFNSKIFPN